MKFKKWNAILTAVGVWVGVQSQLFIGYVAKVDGIDKVDWQLVLMVGAPILITGVTNLVALFIDVKPEATEDDIADRVMDKLNREEQEIEAAERQAANRDPYDRTVTPVDSPLELDELDLSPVTPLTTIEKAEQLRAEQAVDNAPHESTRDHAGDIANMNGPRKLVRSTKHFSEAELECRGVDCCVYQGMDAELMEIAEEVRERFGAQLVTSAERCNIYNATIPGASKKSFHRLRMAIDLKPTRKGVTSTMIYQYLVETYPDQFGFGNYSKQGFVHIDVRQSPYYARKHDQDSNWVQKKIPLSINLN